jgi:hypothetical protein
VKPGKTLKAQNIGWIWAVVAGDVLALAAIAFPSMLDQAASWLASSRIAGVSIAPLIVLLLTSLLPSSVKAVLVFWRVRDVLPAHRAFSVHAPADPRVDLQRLRAAAGDFPSDPRDQNAVWYRLYRGVEAHPIVAEAHRYFLLFRDLAALSIVLVVIAPAALYAIGTAAVAIWWALGFFIVQYGTTAIAARHHGVRLVTNVLALHGAADDPKARKLTRRTLARSTT